MSLQPDTSSGLDISVDRNAEIPIGVQLAWALRSRIRDGRFEPGQRLPGLREVAEATGVNVNTVRSVYQRLEQEGLIDSQQGSGTFVAATPRQQATVTAIAADAAREAQETGVDPREVAAALYVSPGATVVPGDAWPSLDDGAERRRALRGQIASLERTLGEIEAKHPGVAPAREATRAGIGPTLLDADELEQVRTMLVRRLATVQSAIDGLGGDATGAAALADAHDQARSSQRAKGKRAKAKRNGTGEPHAVAGDAAKQRRPRAKPSGQRAPRARGPLRPAPEGA
jgi:DNA-binding transcriptional regulator YhcF (GntR family)